MISNIYSTVELYSKSCCSSPSGESSRSPAKVLILRESTSSDVLPILQVKEKTPKSEHSIHGYCHARDDLRRWEDCCLMQPENKALCHFLSEHQNYF